MSPSLGRPGVVTFIGSGELAPSMSRVHRRVLARVPRPVRAVFVDTPAGFEPNVDDIGGKALAYLRDRLGVACSVCPYRGPGDPPAATLRQGLRRLERANYIFAGPGSPTYAVRAWRGSPVFEAMARRLDEGASLVFASAAAIAVGAVSLPVYEIFKAGADPHWVDGLDLLGTYGLRLAVVPHWNNAEGAGYDTRFCFMGERRFQKLRAALDPGVTALGIDEYTACSVDLASGVCEVLGAGRVTVLNGAGEASFSAGETFSIDLLRGAPLRSGAVSAGEPSRSDETPVERAMRTAVERARAFAAAPERPDPLGAAEVVGDLAAALADAGAAGIATDEAEDALREVLRRWMAALEPGEAADIRPYVDLLVEARSRLRARGVYDVADFIRDGLGALGVTLEDAPAETVWRRR
ncbi:MAG TPA: hypothetical protein VNM43_11675 [Dehalococcoidia bacterium]|nr:hypothetical protein [Dehalococcoidia bacterium]